MRGNAVTAFVIFLFFFVVFWWGSFDKIPFGDCIGFILMAEKGEYVPEATALSHFLYINTVILLRKVFLINEILACRIVSVTTAALSLAVIFLTVFKLTKNRIIAVASAVLLGFSFSFWRNAGLVEVYTYNCMLNALFFYYLIIGVQERKPSALVFASLSLALSLLVHIQNILLIPAILLAAAIIRKGNRAVLQSILPVVLTLVLMAGLNYSQNLPFRFLYSSDAGTWVADTFKKSLGQYFKDILKALGYLLYNFHVFVPIGIAGIWHLLKEFRNLGIVLAFAAALVFGFATFYAVSDNYTFFLPFNYLFVIFAAFGMKYLLKNRPSYSRIALLSLLSPFLYISVAKGTKMTATGQKLDAELSFKGGVDYYLIPWLNDNTGVVETALKKTEIPENAKWMIWRAEDYAKKKKSEGMTDAELLEL